MGGILKKGKGKRNEYNISCCRKRLSMIKKKIVPYVIIAGLGISVLSPQIAEAKTNYKKIYKNFVRNHPSEYFYAKAFDRANYADLNSDGIPELVMWGPEASADSWILTIYKGNVEVQNFHNNPWVEYIKGKNVIRMTGQETEEFYKIRNGEFQCIGYDDYGEYMWNNKTVSARTYKNNVRRLKGRKKYKEAFNDKTTVNPSSWVS